MLKYVCFWKLKDDASAEGKKLVERYLDELPRRVGYVRSWTWGEAISTIGEPFTYGFTAEFDDMAGLRGYLEHPDRVTIEQRVAPHLETRKDAYFETS